MHHRLTKFDAKCHMSLKVKAVALTPGRGNLSFDHNRQSRHIKNSPDWYCWVFVIDCYMYGVSALCFSLSFSAESLYMVVLAAKFYSFLR